jgi:hypothetical protein
MRPTESTLKRLFARSGNQCAFPRCVAPLTHNDTLIGQVCHIRGDKPGAARYDPSQAASERQAYDNLIILCPNHHTVVDDDERAYTVERLFCMKIEHEANAAAIPEADAERVAVLFANQNFSNVGQMGGVSAQNIHAQTINFISSPPVLQATTMPVGSKPIQIVIGHDAPYETVESAGVNRSSTIRVKIENNTDAEISNGKLQVLDLDPPYRGNKDWLLREGISMGDHKHTFVEVAAYNEGTSTARPGTWIRLIVPMGGGFFAECYPHLPVEPHTFHLRFSTLVGGLSEQVYCRLSVDSDRVLHLENWGNSSRPRATGQWKARPDIDARNAFFQILQESKWSEGQLATTTNTNQLTYDWLERRLNTEIHRALRNSELEAWGEEVLSRTVDTPEKPIPADAWDRVEIHFDRTDTPRTSALWRIDRSGLRTAWAGVKFSGEQIFKFFPLKRSL